MMPTQLLCVGCLLFLTATTHCQAFLLSVDSKLYSTCSLVNRESALGASSEEQESHHASLQSVGEGALRSPRLARTIRKNRENRARKTITLVKKQSSRKRVAAKRQKKTKGDELPYESAIVALRAYHRQHSNLVIPRRFIVPVSDEYPTEWHGLDLSSAVYNMRWWLRHVKQNPHRVAELNELGFIWGRLQPEWNLVLEALITYLSLNGDLLVPTKFVVPHDSEHYPKACWGLALGNCVYRIRSRHDFLTGEKAFSRRRQLDGLGFIWDVQEHLFQKFYVALVHFKRLETASQDGAHVSGRALRVPSTFVVPSGEESGWPRQLWGYRLGEKCTAVRQKELYIKNDFERQRALAELGFQWSGNATLGWLKVVHAAAIYSRMHDRNLDVPSNFVVPAPPHIEHGNADAVTGSDDAWPWPGKQRLVTFIHRSSSFAGYF